MKFAAAIVVLCASVLGLVVAPLRDAQLVRHTGALSASSSKSAAAFTAISCSAARACTAVGDYYSAEAKGSLVARWSGRGWHRERAPAIGGSDISKAAVNCPARRRCVAVSRSGAMVWYGNRWKADSRVAGDAVSCPSRWYCVAVGTQGQEVPVSEIWSQGTWRRVRMASPVTPTPKQDVTVRGVSCTSAHFCVAVGGYGYGVAAEPSPGRRALTLAEVWNGHGWRLAPPVDPGSLATLDAVSCRSPRFCDAVGTRATTLPLAEQWTGTSWKVQPTPGLGHVGYGTLDAISCPTARHCEAVGTVIGGAYGGGLLVESLQGVRWVRQVAPAPEAGVTSPSVSCASRSACSAIGTADDRPFFDTWNGRRWLGQVAPPVPTS